MFKSTLTNLSFASRLVLRSRAYQAFAGVLGSSLALLYMILLPSLILGRVSLQALEYITPTEFVFAVLMGSTLSLVLVMNVYAQNEQGLLPQSRHAFSRRKHSTEQPLLHTHNSHSNRASCGFNQRPILRLTRNSGVSRPIRYRLLPALIAFTALLVAADLKGPC